MSPKWQNADKSSTYIARQVGRIFMKDWRQDTQSEVSARSYCSQSVPSGRDPELAALGRQTGELNLEASEATIECF